MRNAKCHAEVRAVGPSPEQGAKLRGRFGESFVTDNADLVFRSQLRESSDVNQHLHWLWGMLNHEQKLIQNLRAAGVRLVIRVYCDRLPVTIEPEAVLLAHKLQLPIEILPQPR